MDVRPNGTANGTAIRALREAKGLSLRSCAAAAQISPSYLSEIERGAKRPRVGAVERIADALAVPDDAITWKECDMTTETDPDDDLRLYTPDQVADLWGISKSWLQKAAASGSIESTYLDLMGSGKGALRLSRDQIKKVLADSVRSPDTRTLRRAV